MEQLLKKINRDWWNKRSKWHRILVRCWDMYKQRWLDWTGNRCAQHPSSANPGGDIGSQPRGSLPGSWEIMTAIKLNKEIHKQLMVFWHFSASLVKSDRVTHHVCQPGLSSIQNWTEEDLHFHLLYIPLSFSPSQTCYLFKKKKRKKCVVKFSVTLD